MDTWVAIVSALVVLAVTVVSFCMDRTRSDTSRAIHRLVSQGTRYSVVSNQDTLPIVGFLHATYGVAYLNAARVAFGDEVVNATCDVDIGTLIDGAMDARATWMRALHELAPTLVPDSDAAVASGWVL